MATLKKTPSAQWPLRASFEFDTATAVNDQMVATDGILSNFKTDAKAFDIVPLPFGAQVIGGEVVVKVASDVVTTHTVAVGDSALATRYLAATSIKAAARTPLVPTGYVSLGEALRITIAATGGGGTVGKVQLMVEFVLQGRANENLKTT